MKQLHIGSKVIVKLYDTREIEGIVKSIHDTTSGQKISVGAKDLALKVDAKQIVKVLS